MNDLANKLFSNELNQPVLKFLDFENNHSLCIRNYRNEPEFNDIWEGDLDFLKINLDIKYKYLINNRAVLLNPVDGEIFAFRFGMWNTALKVQFRDRFWCNKVLGNLKKNFRAAKQKNNYNKLSLNYFSNIYGDDVIDLRILGSNWAIGLYFVEDVDKQIIRYFKKKIE